MLIVLLTLAVFLLVVGAMAVGVIFTGRKLKGSCGGAEGSACVCKGEGKSPEDCPRKGDERPRGPQRASERSLGVLRE